MSKIDELEASIKDYELQILQIDLAILQTEESESTDDLESLKHDIVSFVFISLNHF